MGEMAMSTDKSSSKFIPFVFGIMGLTLVILAFTIPTDTPDTILTAAVGSAGIFGAIIRLPIRKRNSTGETEPVSVDVEAEDRHR
jgi:FtsH-binding integral membrane protein